VVTVVTVIVMPDTVKISVNVNGNFNLN